MKIILDECTPRIVKKRLADLDIQTVQQVGWSGVKNGELLRRIESSGFDVLVTTDQNLRYQQKLRLFRFAVVVLPTNRVPELEQMMDQIRAAILSATPGDTVEVGVIP